MWVGEYALAVALRLWVGARGLRAGLAVLPRAVHHGRWAARDTIEGMEGRC